MEWVTDNELGNLRFGTYKANCAYKIPLERWGSVKCHRLELLKNTKPGFKPFSH